MCRNTATPARQQLIDEFGSAPDEDYPAEAYSYYRAPFVISAEGQAKPYLVQGAYFGLLSYKYGTLANSLGKVKNTENARSETIHELWSYERPWKRAQFCLLPMLAFYEPFWGDHGELKKSVRYSIQRTDHARFTVAGIYDEWQDKDTQQWVRSYALITINGDGHPIAGRMHRPGHEKRTLVVIPNDKRDAWINQTTPEHARAFFVLYSPAVFTCAPSPKDSGRRADGDLL